MHSILVTALVTAATWDAWRWYVLRVAAAPEEAAALAVAVAALAVIGLARRGPAGTAPPAPLAIPPWPIAGVLLLYASAYVPLPAIVRAAIAIAATLYCLHVAVLKQRPPPAFWGLVALSLPVLPSLQFVLGYPMRMISAAMTVGFLHLQGLAVAQQGTFLVWRGNMVQFDAPCSGVSMLWAGVLVTLLGAVVVRLSTARLLVAIAAALMLAIAGNALRAASLFYVEAGLVIDTPAWWHDGVGLAAFALSSAASLWLLVRLARPRMQAAAP